MAAIPFPDEVRDRVTSYIQHQGAKSPGAIVELVQASQQRFLDVVTGLPDDVATRKPATDEWSVRELLRHVIGAEANVVGLVHNLARGDSPPVGGGAERMVEDVGQPLAEFVTLLRTTNERLIDAIRNLPDAPDLTQKAPHPFFGPLNCMEWAAFQRVHDEDHVQHAQKILAAVASA